MSSELLGAYDPPAFSLVNEEGQAPIILTCDHASPAIPGSLNNLGLDDAALARHIAWDIGAAEMTRILARRLDAPAILAGYSRLVIDLNRQPRGEGSIAPKSDGTLVPGNQNLSAEEIEARERLFFDPYHSAVARMIDRAEARGQVPIILMIHSFTPVMADFERPWEIGILWNWDPRLPEPLMARLRAAGHSVGDNEPYSGRGLHGYSQQTHIDARGLAGALVEFRQDLIDTHRGVELWADIFAQALEPLLNDPSLYRIEHHQAPLGEREESKE